MAREDERQRYRRAAETDDFDVALIWAGQGGDAVTSIQPAAAIVAAMASEAQAVLNRLAISGWTTR